MIGVSTINIQGYDTDYSVYIQARFKNIKITIYTEMYLYNFSQKNPPNHSSRSKGGNKNSDNTKHMHNMHY